MSRLPVRVIKVGGSLIELADLAQRLHDWLADQPPAHQVLVAGGGPLVEQVRKLHAIRPLSDTAAHWMCVDLMTVTAHLLHDWLPEIPLIEDDRLLCQRLGERACTIFGAANWLRHSEPYLPGKTLPASWEVTSDSIAARLAIVVQADELVLLKSTLPEAHLDLQQLADIGYVDTHLAALEPELSTIRFANLHWPSDASCPARSSLEDSWSPTPVTRPSRGK